MGNSNDQKKAAKERDRELQLRSSRLEADRFENLKKLLPYMNSDIKIDDFSEEAVYHRMNHYFDSSTVKFSRNTMKSLVSRKKKRFINDQFDLDLAYITKRVIAMGFPSKGLESCYRNSREDTISFMNSYHPTHYRIYNLCVERNRYYHSSLFNGSVSYFPMKDHNPTDLIMMLEFCVDAYLYLAQHEDNVIAVHCKAGKGRTGLMICAYLVFTQGFNDIDAMREYGIRRTYNGKGVTIKSQIRYISYFYRFLKENLGDVFIKKLPGILKSTHGLQKLKNKLDRKVALVQLNIGPIREETKEEPAKICISKLGDEVLWQGTVIPVRFQKDFEQYVFEEDVIGAEDINVSFVSEKMKFSFWVNTYFFVETSSMSRDLPKVSNSQQVGVELRHDELDKFKSKTDPKVSVILFGYLQDKL